MDILTLNPNNTCLLNRDYFDSLGVVLGNLPIYAKDGEHYQVSLTRYFTTKPEEIGWSNYVYITNVYIEIVEHNIGEGTPSICVVGIKNGAWPIHRQTHVDKMSGLVLDNYVSIHEMLTKKQ